MSALTPRLSGLAAGGLAPAMHRAALGSPPSRRHDSVHTCKDAPFEGNDASGFGVQLPEKEQLKSHLYLSGVTDFQLGLCSQPDGGDRELGSEVAAKAGGCVGWRDTCIAHLWLRALKSWRAWSIHFKRWKAFFYVRKHGNVLRLFSHF